MLACIQRRLSSSINSIRTPFKHVGIIILTNDLSPKEMTRFVVTKNLTRYADYNEIWLFKFKLFLEKLLLTQRMKNMEKAFAGLPSIYQPQDKLLDEVVGKMTTNYPQTKFTVYKKTISETKEVHSIMDKLIDDKVDHAMLFPIKPSYTCSEWSREIFDITTYLKINKEKINFNISCIQPYRLRKDFTRLMANSIERALKSLKKVKNKEYVVLFVAPYIKLDEIKHGDLSYSSYYAMADTIMSKINLPNHHIVTWNLTENNEDNYLMPNTLAALRYLVRNHKKTAFLLVPLTNIFDGRLMRYEFDLDMTSAIKRLEPHVNLSKLAPIDRNPELINIFYKILCEHLDDNTQRFPWYSLEKDPDCIHKSCQETRAILTEFVNNSTLLVNAPEST